MVAANSLDIESYYDLNIYNTKRQRLYLQPQDSELHKEGKRIII